MEYMLQDAKTKRINPPFQHSEDAWRRCHAFYCFEWSYRLRRSGWAVAGLHVEGLIEGSHDGNLTHPDNGEWHGIWWTVRKKTFCDSDQQEKDVIVNELMMVDVMLSDGCCFQYDFFGWGTKFNKTETKGVIFLFLSYLRYDFGKGRVGKRHQVEFTLYNQGDIPATARFDAWIDEGWQKFWNGSGCWYFLGGVVRFLGGLSYYYHITFFLYSMMIIS